MKVMLYDAVEQAPSADSWLPLFYLMQLLIFKKFLKACHHYGAKNLKIASPKYHCMHFVQCSSIFGFLAM